MLARPKPAVPMLDVLLRIREDMVARPAGLYRYIGTPDVGYVNCFKGGYAEGLRSLGVQTGADVLFTAWLRNVNQASPDEDWEPAYLRDCAGDHTRALRLFLDRVEEFRALPAGELAALPGSAPEEARLATHPPQLLPTQEPLSTLEFLLRLRAEVEADPGHLSRSIGPLEVRRMEGLIAGYRLCLSLAGIRDGAYTRFERWLHEEKGLPSGQDWPEPFLAACQGNAEQAIRRLLDFAAEFRGH